MSGKGKMGNIGDKELRARVSKVNAHKRTASSKQIHFRKVLSLRCIIWEKKSTEHRFTDLDFGSSYFGS